MSKAMVSVLVASGFMGVGYFLLNTVSEKNSDEIRKVYPKQPGVNILPVAFPFENIIFKLSFYSFPL